MHTRIRFSLLASAALVAVGLAGRAYAASPPAPWTAIEIGKQFAPSLVDVDGRGLWNIRADDGDIFGKADTMVFVYQPLSGDGSIAAAILGQHGGDPSWAKSGVHIRASDVDSAQNVDIHMTSGNGLEFSSRPVAKKDTTSYGGTTLYGARVFPTWLRLQRDGDSFTPFVAYDGLAWTQVHSPITIAGFPKDALAGLSVASHTAKAGNPVTAVYTPPVVTPGFNAPIVQACSGNGAVLLTWQPVANAVGYVVRRSASDAPALAADALTPAPIKETSFSDSNLANGKAVRYLVSAVFDQGGTMVEGYATSISVTPNTNPGNLATCDINLENTLLRGALTFDEATATYTISGSGGDIWDNADRFFFASQLVKGDFQITAKLLGKPSKTSDWSKAGVMIRESLDGPSRDANLMGTFKNGVNFQWRDATGGAPGGAAKAAITNAAFTGPAFVRLVRKGSTITAFISTDGTTFTQAGDPKTFDPPLADSLYAGLAITAHNASAVATAQLSDVSIGPAAQ
jgi:hypothetical protein